MDQNILVKSGEDLIRLLDETPARPDMAMWVYSSDSDSWKLWIAPNPAVKNKLDFYRIVTEQMNAHRDDPRGLADISTLYVEPESAPVKALRKLMHIPDIGSRPLSGSMVDGYYLPEGIAVRIR